MSLRKDRVRVQFMEMLPEVSVEEFQTYILGTIERFNALPIVQSNIFKYDFAFSKKDDEENLQLNAVVNSLGGGVSVWDFVVSAEGESFNKMAETVASPDFDAVLQERFQKAFSRDFQVFSCNFATGIEGHDSLSLLTRSPPSRIRVYHSSLQQPALSHAPHGAPLSSSGSQELLETKS
ncbi:hypothetical protein FB451DRAFT_1183157 [Mycena latifolia]|nr:hypothetical protein FB451DRAFT_1183157 [Mycena latifolia]